MKIVKQFEDHNFFKKNFYLAFEESELKKGKWFWGLGDDGDLYCQCSDFEDPQEWHHFEDTSFRICSISDMKRIIKEFGHLVVFI